MWLLFVWLIESRDLKSIGFRFCNIYFYKELALQILF